MRGDSWFVVSQWLTTVGAAIEAEPKVRLERPTAEDLGAAVLEALAGSRSGVEPPADWSRIGKEVLRFLGEKSWRALGKHTRSFGVLARGAGLEIRTYEFDSSDGGFRGTDEVLSCERHEVGGKLIQRVASSQGTPG